MPIAYGRSQYAMKFYYNYFMCISEAEEEAENDNQPASPPTSHSPQSSPPNAGGIFLQQHYFVN